MTPQVERCDYDGFYYRSSDLEWLCKPTDDDPGITGPKKGAIPLGESKEQALICLAEFAKV